MVRGCLTRSKEDVVPIFKRRNTPERDWDPEQWVLVTNKSSKNILLDLPTGYFRLDIGRSFRMTPDVVDLPQVKDLVDAGQIEIGQRQK
jgi:hypothetical protein